MKKILLTLLLFFVALPYFFSLMTVAPLDNRREVASVEELYYDQELDEQSSDSDCVECAIQKQQNQVQLQLAQSIAANQQILMAMGQGQAAPTSMSVYQQMDAITAQMLGSSMPTINNYQFQTPVLDQLYQQQFISNQASWAPTSSLEFAMPQAAGFSMIAPHASAIIQGNDPFGRYDQFLTTPEFNFSNQGEQMPATASVETPMFI